MTDSMIDTTTNALESQIDNEITLNSAVASEFTTSTATDNVANEVDEAAAAKALAAEEAAGVLRRAGQEGALQRHGRPGCRSGEAYH